jgi:hypothetical protein
MPVFRHGIGDNLVEADPSESIIDHGQGSFKRVTLAPNTDGRVASPSRLPA